MNPQRGKEEESPSFENATSSGTQTKSELKLILKLPGVVVAGGPHCGGHRRSHREGEVARPPARCRYPALAQARDRPISAVMHAPAQKRRRWGKVVRVTEGFPPVKYPRSRESLPMQDAPRRRARRHRRSAQSRREARGTSEDSRSWKETGWVNVGEGYNNYNDEERGTTTTVRGRCCTG